MSLIKKYNKELIEALLSEDDEILKQHMRKWKIEIPEDPAIFQMMKHKAICNKTNLPSELQKKSRNWLAERNLSEFLYEEEFKKALAAEDDDALKQYTKKWYPNNPELLEVFQIMKHIRIANNNNLPIETREKSLDWLEKNSK